MVNNKADTIEDYILQKLSEQGDGQVELNRTELADKISCAPSQISYVLSTRFTHDRGFVVESRRGLGGYIRITILADVETEKQLMYEKFIQDIDETTNFVTVKSMIDYILESRLITRREAEIVAQTIYSLYRSEAEGKLASSERTKLLRNIFSTLRKIT